MSGLEASVRPRSSRDSEKISGAGNVQGRRVAARRAGATLQNGKQGFGDCHFGLMPQTSDLLRFSGGDDGARTRDLCRDRAAL
jgi:hypothetical protein